MLVDEEERKAAAKPAPQQPAKSLPELSSFEATVLGWIVDGTGSTPFELHNRKGGPLKEIADTCRQLGRKGYVRMDGPQATPLYDRHGQPVARKEAAE